MIKEPPHLGNDKPWMSQLKNWCRTVKDEFERTALRGDNVTTSISSGIVHAHRQPFPQWQCVSVGDSIKVFGGYVNWGESVVMSWPISEDFEEFEVSTLEDGDYYIVWFTDSAVTSAGSVEIVTADYLSEVLFWYDFHILSSMKKVGDYNVITQKQTDEIVVNVSKQKKFKIVEPNAGSAYSSNLACYPIVRGEVVEEAETTDVLKIPSLQELEIDKYKYEAPNNSIRRDLFDEDKVWRLQPKQYYADEIILAVWGGDTWYDLNIADRRWERIPVDEIPEFEEPLPGGDDPCEHPGDGDGDGEGGGVSDDPDDPYDDPDDDPDHPGDEPCD